MNTKNLNRRFTILTHYSPSLHWDFLVENGETLFAWRLLEQPDREAIFEVEPLPPHRKIYLDYEGPISNNRGTVQQWDTGFCEILKTDDSEFQFVLIGKRLSGLLRIVKNTQTERWVCYSPGSCSSDG